MIRRQGRLGDAPARRSVSLELSEAEVHGW